VSFEVPKELVLAFANEFQDPATTIRPHGRYYRTPFLRTADRDA
jgi:hypothetical protein